MIQHIIYKFLHHRHFWRYATFSEIAELYASRLMRIFALRLVAVFTTVYIYQITGDVPFVIAFWALYYLAKVAFSYPSARIVSRWGPKHGTLVSSVVSALAMAALPFAANPVYGYAALLVWAGLQAFSSTLYDLSYLVEFSKVKHVNHTGKELGYMNIVEKVATGFSPAAGGLLAFFAGPEAVMFVSASLFLLSAIPLLLTPEPVPTRHQLSLRQFPWRSTWRSFVAEAAVGVDVYTTSITWSLFLVVAIFTSGTDAVYAEVGAVASVTMIVAIIMSYTFGYLIDNRRGGALLRFGVFSNSIVHVLRPFVGTPIGVVLLNILNEMSTSSYGMAFTRGMFDMADRSRRIEYMFIIELAVNAGACIMGALFYVLALYVGTHNLFYAGFFIPAVLTLLIATPRFILYRK